MDMDPLLKILHLMIRLEALKRTARAGWNKKDFPPGSPCKPRTVANAESVADHSWSLGLFVFAVARHLGLDVEKMVAMAILHDVPEYITGDKVTIVLPPEERARAKAEKRVLEDRVMRETFLPLGDFGRECYELWLEYEANTSVEAQVVHQLDKIETCLQALCYSQQQDKDGNLVKEVVAEEFFNNVTEYIHRPEFIAMLNELRRLSAAPS